MLWILLYQTQIKRSDKECISLQCVWCPFVCACVRTHMAVVSVCKSLYYIFKELPQKHLVFTNITNARYIGLISSFFYTS